MAKLTRAASTFLLVVVATCGWFGLAVLGWAGFAAFFSNDARIALSVVVAVLLVASVFTQGNLSKGQREDRGNRWVLAAFGIIGLLDAYLPAWSDRNEFWTVDGDTMRWLGVVLFAVGGVLRVWPVYVLGRRFSGLVAIQRDHTLITTGIYRHIRNPSYLGMIVMTFGWGLAFRSSIGVVLAVLLLPPLIARMASEEALLREHFGAEYEAYRARTARLIPGLY